MRNKIVIGIATSTAPAAKVVKSLLVRPVIISNRPIASVLFLSDKMTSRAKMKSIHGPIKLLTAINVSIGTERGIIMRTKIVVWDAPSIFAASSKLRGRPSKYPLTSQVPKGMDPPA
ncbi:hypothetical protein D3C73_1180940 [compost metagenome]